MGNTNSCLGKKNPESGNDDDIITIHSNNPPTNNVSNEPVGTGASEKTPPKLDWPLFRSFPRHDLLPDEIDLYPDAFPKPNDPTQKQLSDEAKEMDKADSRFYTTEDLPNSLSQQAKDSRKAVGAIIINANLKKVNGGYALQKVANNLTVRENANTLAQYASYDRKVQYADAINPQNEGKFPFVDVEAPPDMKMRFTNNVVHPRVMPDEYKFAGDLCFAPVTGSDDMLGGYGTVYHIGSGMIATAAHTLISRDLNGFSIVFDLSDIYCKPNKHDGTFETIPERNVFRLRRKICGQYGKPFNAALGDQLDWMLLELEPNNISWPPSVSLLAPMDLPDIFKYPGKLFTIGHPWGTSAKISYPNIGQKLLSKDEKPPHKEFFNCILHNLLIRVGNSGGPIFLDHPKHGLIVIASQGTLIYPGRAKIEKFGFYVKKPSNCLSLIPPDNIRCLSACTKTSIWTHLINPKSVINILCILPATAPHGRLSFRLRLNTMLDCFGAQANVRCGLGECEIIPGTPNALKLAIPFDEMNFVDKVRAEKAVLIPANMIALEVGFTPIQSPPAADTIVGENLWEKRSEFSQYAFEAKDQLSQYDFVPKDKLFSLDQLVLHIEGPGDENNPLTRVVITRLWGVPMYKRTDPVTGSVTGEVKMNAPGWQRIGYELRDGAQEDERRFKELGVPVHKYEFPDVGKKV